MMWARFGRLAAAAACAGVLSGCAVVPAGYYDGYYSSAYYYPGAGEGVALADVAPPAPLYETVPVAPFVGAIWFGGYWNWHGGRYAWVPGHWGRGRPGYVWHPYHWAPRGSHWAMSGGWSRAHH